MYFLLFSLVHFYTNSALIYGFLYTLPNWIAKIRDVQISKDGCIGSAYCFEKSELGKLGKFAFKCDLNCISPPPLVTGRPSEKPFS